MRCTQKLLSASSIWRARGEAGPSAAYARASRTRSRGVHGEMEDLLASWRRTSEARPSSRAATWGGSGGGGGAVAAVTAVLPLLDAQLAAVGPAGVPNSLAQAQARSAKSVEEKLPCVG